MKTVSMKQLYSQLNKTSTKNSPVTLLKKKQRIVATICRLENAFVSSSDGCYLQDLMEARCRRVTG